ncbi:hypothetical protein ACLESD_48670 [Pyxidicoccus sp. 3LFB2]
MKPTREDWWRSVRERRQGLFLKLLRARAPLEEFARELLAQEKELGREAPTPAARLELQQLTAKDLLTQAYSPRVSWAEFGPLLRRCQRIGYADITHEVHVACLFVQSLPRFPDKARQAFTLLDAAERKVKRLRKSHVLRQEGLQAITHARRVAEAAGIAAPPAGRPKKTSRP